MAKDLFYLASYKNVGKLFETILTAKAPEAFTVAFLNDTIGLKSTTDRPLINMLKKLGFLDTAGVPTPTYSLLKNKDTAKATIAEGLKKTYEPLFEANEKANELPMEQLKGLVSQVTGGEQNIVNNVAWTFNAIVKSADFTKAVPKKTTPGDPAAPVIPAFLTGCVRSSTSTFRSISPRTAPKRPTSTSSTRCGGHLVEGRSSVAIPHAWANGPECRQQVA